MCYLDRNLGQVVGVAKARGDVEAEAVVVLQDVVTQLQAVDAAGPEGRGTLMGGFDLRVTLCCGTQQHPEHISQPI